MQTSMHKVFDDIWRIYPENMLKNRTWHWWWWIHFFENPDAPEFPKQLMVLWGTRNCRTVRVNDYCWEPTIPVEINGKHAAFESMVASWYYDGKRMHEPLLLDHGKTETERDDHSGRLRMEGHKGVYSYGGSSADFWLKIETDNVGIELSMERWKDVMAELVPTGKNFVGNMGYSMLKYRGLSSSGRIRVGDIETPVKGRSYFQKVRISSITPCWYWGTVQWDNGGYLQYFLPHIGIPMFRHSISHDSTMDWGERMISKTLDFYDPEEGKEYSMEDVKITKRYENGLPIFNVSASSGQTELSIEMATYARCSWKISQPLIGPIWSWIFYNEYPATVRNFKFKSNNRSANNHNFGKSYCNCEHTWGLV
ncbi:MAG: hypothetical protein ABSC50_06675 [Candidatus Bathyarchaeia archaeon]